jgi:tetratricopeptide (TPR) repeat protein
VVVAAIAFWFIRGRRPARTAGEHKAVAVLYFSNLSQDPAFTWLDSGLTDMLTTNLAQIKGMDVLSTDRVLNAVQRVGKKDGGMNPAQAQEVARDIGADAYVTGAVLKLGPTRWRVDVRLQDTRSGQIMFSEKVEGNDTQSIFSMVDSLTSRIAHNLLPESSLPEKSPLIEEASTSNIEAYRHYQLGRDYARRFLNSDAIPEFEAAIRLDPQFARAYLWLGSQYTQLGDLRRGAEIDSKVGSMASRLPRYEQLLRQSFNSQRAQDPELGAQALQEMIAEFPRESDARGALAQVLSTLNRREDSLRVLREGLELDPKDETLLNVQAYQLAYGGDVNGALQSDDRYMALRPGDPNPVDTRGDVLYLSFREDEAAAAYHKVLDLRPDFSDYADYLKLAILYGNQRKSAMAEAAFRQYAAHASEVGRLYVPVLQAQLQQLHGDFEGARDSYGKGVAQLSRAGQMESAAAALGAYAAVSLALNDASNALAFARRQNLRGQELGTVSFLEANTGNMSAAAGTLKRFAAACPWLSARVMEQQRVLQEMSVAIGRNDGAGALKSAARIPELQVSPHLFLRARAHLLVGDYGPAERELQRLTVTERLLSNPRQIIQRLPALEILAHYYLGLIYEKTGKREQAVNQYQEFLSRFENSHTRLPQLTEARAALSRLMR